MLPAEMDATKSPGVRKPKFCPECGSKVGEADTFCGGCGSPVAGAPPNGVSTDSVPTSPASAAEPSAAPRRRTLDWAALDWTTFGAALALGSVWAILNLRRGSLRWGWLCLLGALPATLVVWASLHMLYRNLTVPYAVLAYRGDTHVIVPLALLARAVLTLPMALDAARRPQDWPHPQRSLRTMGLAGLAAVLAILGLDLATHRGRSRASADELATRVKVAVRYNGTWPSEPSVGGYTVRVSGPRLLPTAAVAMRLYVRDDTHTGEFGFDAGKRSGPYGMDIDEYRGDQEITFSATGPRPTYVLYVGGKVAARGDLQPRGAQ